VRSFYLADRNLAPASFAPSRVGDDRMFIAMNRFRVAKGSEAAFEQVWMSRNRSSAESFNLPCR
jgi:hypothetical protein